MAKRSSSPDKLTIKGLSQDDQDWLRAESDRLGCDPENLVRMMIRQRSAPTPPAPQPPNGGGYRPGYYQWADSPLTSDVTRGADQGPDLPHHAPPTINEAEPSLDALMAAGPSLLDDPPAPVVRLRPSPSRMHVPMRPMRERTPYPRGGFDAFTETEFVGINQAVIGANMMGDGSGNVMRDNLRHFGVKGTVRR
jgi:hypothetical protein